MGTTRTPTTRIKRAAAQIQISRQVDDVSRELTLVEASEIAVKAASFAVVLTYISGYLIVSTYLNSFGISADASDFLRARYFYVGFLYILCLGIMALALVSTKKIFDLKDIRGGKVFSDQEREHLRDRARRVNEYSFALWVVIVTVFVFAVTLQITFLRPERIRDYLLLQSGLLGSFLFYQLTYYRSFYNPEWDYASWSVFWLRARCAIALVVFMCLIIASKGSSNFLVLRLRR